MLNEDQAFEELMDFFSEENINKMNKEIEEGTFSLEEKQEPIIVFEKTKVETDENEEDESNQKKHGRDTDMHSDRGSLLDSGITVSGRGGTGNCNNIRHAACHAYKRQIPV